MKIRKLGSAGLKLVAAAGCAVSGYGLIGSDKLTLLLRPLGIATTASGGVMLKQAFEDAKDAFRNDEETNED